MKGISESRRFLFITILCLLWLPNYCDIKQNEADSSYIQSAESSPTDPTENVQTNHEKENLESLGSYPEKLNVQSNVEYVNNVSKKKMKNNILKKISDIPEFPEEESVQKNKDAKEPVIITQPVNLDALKDLSGDKVISSKSSEQPSPIPVEVVTPLDTLLPPSVLQEQPVLKKTIEGSILMAESPTQSTVDKSTVEEVKSAHPPVHLEAIKPVSDIHQPHYDGMPSFDEWKKMMLAQQEKGGQKIPSPLPPGKKISSQKRRRNCSSYECGAKIVASNSEAEGSSRILNELVDEYMLNPCKANIWFVIELCETVQATQIELANFELFSSSPKEFAVYSSDNFPTRDWVRLGTFHAAEQRALQSFELKQEGFGKFIKIELLSHYGKEHYCPLSVVRIFGASMVDEYEEMETLANHPSVLDDDMDRLDLSVEDKKSNNIFGSATDAVLNIVKKAAQALGHQNLEERNNKTNRDQPNTSDMKLCNNVDNSSDKCKDFPTSMKNFSGFPSSVHQSLFRLLHRCDQCVPSRIRYYSSAQPHCRFFQAAFGPLMFQNLCDWFKEHPLVFAHESSAHRDKISPQILITTTSKSPPPQIWVMPVDNDTSMKKMFLGDAVPSSVNETNNSQRFAFASLEKDKFASFTENISLEGSIQPSVVRQEAENTTPLVKDNQQSSPSFAEPINVLPTVVETVPRKSTLPFQDNSMDIHEEIVESNSIPDILTEANDDEELIATTEDITLADVTEVPSSLYDKSTEVPNVNQGKIVEPVSIGAPTASQKESVFMRMSNRIKSLELNMSLSSQYLQELSQRYRRQMDEMQRAFNRTIGTLNDTAKKAAERDLKQQEILNGLQIQVESLSMVVEVLLNERATLFRQLTETHVCIMVIEAIVMITIMSLYVRRIKSSANITSNTGTKSLRLCKRRSSVDSCATPIARKIQKRSASEEALMTAEEVLIVEPLPVLLDPILKAKKKHRRRNRVQRSISQPIVQRRGSVPTSQCKTHSDGCMNVKSNACENCHDKILCADVNRERRVAAPLKNLTNEMPPPKCQKLGKDKFSFRKLLKFQKRDSI